MISCRSHTFRFLLMSCAMLQRRTLLRANQLAARAGRGRGGVRGCCAKGPHAAPGLAMHHLGMRCCKFPTRLCNRRLRTDAYNVSYSAGKGNCGHACAGTENQMIIDVMMIPQSSSGFRTYSADDTTCVYE
jgi:hypothetical protein